MPDTASLMALARQKTRAEFVALIKNLVLLVSSETPGGPPIAFETVAVPTAEGVPIVDAAPSIEVIEVVKAPGNPYPERISVGRARNCDVVLRDASISKLHAHFRVVDGDLFRLELVDHGSYNGTRIGGLRIRPQTPTPVQVGDSIAFGRVSARLLDAPILYETLRTLGRAGTALEKRRA
jgi:hypothetical protein